MKTKYIIATKLLILVMAIAGCKKFVNIEGIETSVSSKNVFNNDATAIGAISSLYVSLGNQVLGYPNYLTSISCIGGLSADELTYYNLAGSSILESYYKNNLTDQNAGDPGFWGGIYQGMYLINTAIEEVGVSTGLSKKVKQQVLGEAKFMRAFYYFYIVNVYGEGPLILTTDYTANSLVSKATSASIYQQIISDLKDAQNLLNDNYVQGDGMTNYPSELEERVRPTKSVATALLARTYLYLSDWGNAEIQASNIINNISEYRLETVDKVFLKNNKEAIWQLQPTSGFTNTKEGDFFVLRASGPSVENPVYLNSDLVSSFEPGDKRMANWIGSVFTNNTRYYYANKYKIIVSGDPNAPISEYSTVFRLAEQFLIRSEARAQQNNLSGAVSDIDQIRERAGVSLVSVVKPDISRADLLTAILKERRVEFFTEWGHRWLDLKRTGLIGEVMNIATPKKSNGGVWKDYQRNYPIPLSELRKSPNLQQIDGY